MVISGAKRPDSKRKIESGSSPCKVPSETSLSSDHSSPMLSQAMPVSRPDVRSEAVVAQQNYTSDSASDKSLPLRTVGGLDVAAEGSPLSRSPAISPFHSYNPTRGSGAATMHPTASLPAKVSGGSSAGELLRSQSTVTQNSDFESTYYDSVKEWEDPEDDYIFVLDSQDGIEVRE